MGQWSSNLSSFTERAAKNARPARAKPSFAGKAIEAPGWVLHDETNSSGYDSQQCDGLTKKLRLLLQKRHYRHESSFDLTQ